MKSLCSADCANCQWNSTCPGCSDEKCFIARYIKKDGREAYEEFKRTVIDEINSLDIPGMPKINELYALVGNFVNLEYPLHSGQKVRFLDNNSMYLGNQVECELHKGADATEWLRVLNSCLSASTAKTAQIRKSSCISAGNYGERYGKMGPMAWVSPI